jgi:hypothetical protein
VVYRGCSPSTQRASVTTAARTATRRGPGGLDPSAAQTYPARVTRALAPVALLMRTGRACISSAAHDLHLAPVGCPAVPFWPPRVVVCRVWRIGTVPPARSPHLLAVSGSRCGSDRDGLCSVEATTGLYDPDLAP